MTRKTPKTPKSKKPSPKPQLSVVVPFPEDHIARDRDFENLIRRLRKAKDRLTDIMVLGFEDDKYLWYTNNGTNRKDALWLLEMARLDVMGMLPEENEEEEDTND